ncbi:MAG TPA: hypothetical protein VH392_10355, partial [Sphingomicrobium sp.]
MIHAINEFVRASAFRPARFHSLSLPGGLSHRGAANDDIEARFDHSTAATRFATTCAAVGGTTMLHDLMPDVVTVSFGSRTGEIWKRLRQRGWSFVGKGEWRDEPVLGVSFNGDRRAN